MNKEAKPENACKHEWDYCASSSERQCHKCRALKGYKGEWAKYNIKETKPSKKKVRK
jgi:hypothetical protein